MSKFKCPTCKKEMKKASWKQHDTNFHGGKLSAVAAVSDNVEWNEVEYQLANGPQLGGELSRLRSLARHDQSQNWQEVLDIYRKQGARPKEEGSHNQLEKINRRVALNRGRIIGKW